MTAYDEPTASDGNAGAHPLAGVPQEVLDAATASLTAAMRWEKIDLDADDMRAIAESVLAQAILAWRAKDPQMWPGGSAAMTAADKVAVVKLVKEMGWPVAVGFTRDGLAVRMTEENTAVEAAIRKVCRGSVEFKVIGPVVAH